MTRCDWACVVSVGLLTVFIQLATVRALSCFPCDLTKTCPCVPDDCEKGLRPCGCCYECKGKVGAACSGLDIPSTAVAAGVNAANHAATYPDCHRRELSSSACESDLMCVNSKGVALPQLRWYDMAFQGTCQKVASCQVIENYEP
ncbi:hypothetical protein LSAT2_032567 [Lamellibrachia satsuma]|nr:hypothetical protein LSAT2_032567 [Lamellibrachia satsuma]